MFDKLLFFHADSKGGRWFPSLPAALLRMIAPCRVRAVASITLIGDANASRPGSREIEDAADLIADLRQALDAVSAQPPGRTRENAVSTVVEEPVLA
jgi:hypothetical protein